MAYRRIVLIGVVCSVILSVFSVRTENVPSAQHGEGGDYKHSKKKEESTPKENEIKHVDVDIESLFSFNGKDLWGKDYLQERINVRLVLKPWQAWGPANLTEEVLQEFPQDQPSDYLRACLDGTPPYQYLERPLTEAHLLLGDKGYHKDLPNIFIFPPSMAHQHVGFVQKTVTALAMRNLHRSHNVFTFDLSRVDFNVFVSVLNINFGENPDLNLMGKAIADFFIKGIEKGEREHHMKEEDIHLVGWGYSAQLIGYLGRLMFQKTGHKIGSIIALNPSGSPNNKLMKAVSKEDAALVYVYHSNSYPTGSTAREGTADFVFNGGFIQPECTDKDEEFPCSHDGVLSRFWYMILYGGNLFEARKCESLVRYNFGLCNESPSVKLTYPLSRKTIEGKHFLRTSGVPPYGLAGPGSESDPEVRRTMETAIINHYETGTSTDDIMMFLMELMD